MRTINNLEQLPSILTAKDVQDFLQISKSRAYELFKEESFPAIVIGGNKRVYRDEFLEWVDTRKIINN
ncbi:helix-turn-helix transcriptional regulator [Mesobacillus stamsii]|uniref:DNA-binding transcriptional regulator AlpA n=1 Tax=Mesobacillus stamsii TaxID=225347 RepID=A0ABU0FRY1_9BACI|nr:helix-turn-helix domain-containing protein [Mesobacillus stamsii]MDQ0412678.1 putative DNA-binding transcriptional regulator AlpA [Mesobacillus stamsii]